MLEGNKRYTIEITEVSQENTLTVRNWSVTKEVGDVKEWDYTPQIEAVEKVQRQLLKQNVSELDLVAVIKAINRIE